MDNVLGTKECHIKILIINLHGLIQSHRGLWTEKLIQIRSVPYDMMEGVLGVSFHPGQSEVQHAR